jgi:hypothetical protein
MMVKSPRRKTCGTMTKPGVVIVVLVAAQGILCLNSTCSSINSVEMSVPEAELEIHQIVPHLYLEQTRRVHVKHVLESIFICKSHREQGISIIEQRSSPTGQIQFLTHLPNEMRVAIGRWRFVLLNSVRQLA